MGKSDKPAKTHAPPRRPEDLQQILDALIKAHIVDEVVEIKEMTGVIMGALRPRLSREDAGIVRGHLLAEDVIVPKGKGSVFHLGAGAIRRYCRKYGVELPANFDEHLPRIVGLDEAQQRHEAMQRRLEAERARVAASAPAPVPAFVRGTPVVPPDPPPAPTTPPPPDPEPPVVISKAKPVMRVIPLDRLRLTHEEVKRDPVLAGIIAATATDNKYRRGKVRKVLDEYLRRVRRKSKSRDFLRDIREFDEKTQDYMIRLHISFWLGDPEPTE